MMISCFPSLLALLLLLPAGGDDFPLVADDLEVSLFAKNPLVRNPCAITFDAKGRLCVGMGPQYRNPKPDTPGDSVWILIDEDENGSADSRKQYATGFNSIQGLAWRGRDLYVANAPDLTIARDLDGDDVADEYIRLFTDLGNLEHALHGLQFGPDGKLYMSKGNSKGLTRPPDRIAPKPFRELWGVEMPVAPDFPKPIAFKKGDFEKNYHDPADDWGLSGGVLRCDPDGSNLEIVSRGFRNPWDICFDDSFNWLGTDNDQTQGDKIFSPFYGAHFGWGHPWSFDWKGDGHLPTAPSSGPLFEGSGTGVTYCGLEHYPKKYRGIFLINDWLRREVIIYRSKWEGAWMKPDREKLEIFAHAGGGRSMGQSTGRSFDPVDIEVGPDGAIYISSWGREYGLSEKDGEQINEGRIYRIWPKAVPPRMKKEPKRQRSIREWTTQQLLDDLEESLPVWRTNAQNELVRRGKRELNSEESHSHASKQGSVWALWTMGRMAPKNDKWDDIFLTSLAGDHGTEDRTQLIRILAHRAKARGANTLPDLLIRDLEGENPRSRHATVLAMRQVGETRWNKKLLRLIEQEQDRIVSYSAWGALGELMPREERKALLNNQVPAVRRAALLSLLEEDALSEEELKPLTRDSDQVTAELAIRRLGGKHRTEIRGARLNSKNTNVIPERAERTPVSVVSAIHSLPDRSYKEAILTAGARAFTDRPYRLTTIPAQLEGLTFIRPANNDADHASGPFLNLTLRYDSKVYFADDIRGEKLPTWARGKWTPTDMFIKTNDSAHRVYSAEFSAGKICFGANRDGVNGRKGNYFIIIKPKLLQPQATTATVADVLPLLKSANSLRGRALFLSTSGASCATCHQLEGFGNIFAPDLTGIGTRATPEFLVRSILEPSSEITEGFAMQILTTKSGDTTAGIVLEETGLSVKIAMMDGALVTILKKNIIKRQTAPISAMPPIFSGLLSPQDVADITAYLLVPKEEPKTIQTPRPHAKQLPKISPRQPSPLSGKQWGHKGKGFYFDCHDQRLEIRYDGVEIASYYYNHPETQRPFFAHVKTPSGIQVTRNFPPIAGKDATDHATMHPGIWMGFANLDGISFWHNNAGKVNHIEFPVEPSAGVTASFAVKNCYLAPDNRVVCEEWTSYHLIPNKDGFLISIDSRFFGDRPFSFGVKEEMGLGLRVASPITVKGGKGSILSATGGKNEKGTWGMIDQWWDYFGPLGGMSAGVQIMSGSGNPAVWAHSRDYGVLVANPFPVDRPGNRDKKIAVQPGESFRLKFGVQVHEHNARENYDPAKAYRRYLNGAK
ncbi:MAG: PmoA family protein [Akkermansiaceae bacterium]|nr:PmoA family protein [Akkermansiaceae bacterium]